MTTERHLLNDMARMASSAAGTVMGMRDDIKSGLRSQVERLLPTMDLVRRDEFEALWSMAEQARLENEQLKAQLRDLEAKVSQS